ncbi:spore protease YyaC [Desulfitibacter alkalitolerans]|uniref:spore protease YyaC n=1 Tax=Desulfitibacter alkalitolerans TaxID=264641 RepID=UPI00054D9173|nr:spore protease YyaC [Desulfitibacter alkalitolerans]
MTTLLRNLLNRELQEPPDKIVHHIDDENLTYKAANQLASYLITLDPQLDRPIVVVNIGTDRSTGDSLGPLVGSFLKERQSLIPNIHVYGTLDEPVHATNIVRYMEDIMETHTNPIIIAVDACLGQAKNVGNLNLGIGPVKPGAGVKKELPYVGHIYMTGTVNVGGYLEYLVLQNTRLNLVMKLAKSISDTIYKAYYKVQAKKNEVPSH